MDRQGYRKAEHWLLSFKRPEELEGLDGFSVVHWANYLWEKQHAGDKE